MDLRLFPLQTVLFPGMRIPLQIFEDRYKLMIRECLEEDTPFGVLLIRSGEEVGGGAIPFEVGTTARIQQVRYLDDGRMQILALGERRFRTVALNTSQPYLRGEVELVDQRPPTSAAAELLPKAGETFVDYLKTYMALNQQWIRGVDVPEDPREAGDYIAARLDVPPQMRQELLEQLSPDARLLREIEIMMEELPDMRLRLRAYLRQKTAGFGVLN